LRKIALLTGLGLALVVGSVAAPVAVEYNLGVAVAAPKEGRPASATWDNPGKSAAKLHKGALAAAGMRAEPLQAIDPFIEQAIADKMMPGAVVLIARNGVIVKEQAYGYAARYADANFTPLDQPIAMKTDTIFDLASVSKLFTTTAVMQLYDQGKIELDRPVAAYIPEFATNGKDKITIRQLLTHISGFEPGIPIWKVDADREGRLQEVFRHTLQNPPGSKYVYSDLNLITLGAVVERITGKRLDEYVRENITQPLGMNDTMYNPPAKRKPRIAATEEEPWAERGLVWGEVHDEKAWSLDGVAGHAGVFSTAGDLAVFAQMMLNGGTYDNKRILSKEAVALMAENQIPQFPEDDHGLGWELNQGWYMDALSDTSSLGHTGFTGTSIVVSPANNTICILLTNRVHPTRQTVSTNPVRRGVARQAALAIPVDIPWKKEGAWFAGMGDQLQNTLTAEVDLAAGGTLSFDTWFRIEPDKDFGYVEASSDGQSWTALGTAAFTGKSEWTPYSYQFPAGTKQVRFRYSTNETANGRGWYVHEPQIKNAQGQKLKTAWKAAGWSQAAE
jgi:CubicO group peptidase (beta-lactamase class C family)